MLPLEQVAERASQGTLRTSLPQERQQEQEASASLDGTLRQATTKQAMKLDADIAANLDLAWAKYYLTRLVASHAKFIDDLPAPETPFPTAAQFPPILM